MELLFQGHSLFLSDLYEEASHLYEQATSSPDFAAEAFTSWSYCLLKQGDLKSAISKAESAISINPNNYLCHFRKAQGLFYSQHFGAALELFLHCNTLKPNSSNSWISKCEAELKNMAPKEPYTWFQSSEEVHLIFFVKTASSEDVKLELLDSSVSITAKTVTGSDFLHSVKLLHRVDPSRSSFSVKSGKVEVVLKKQENVIWASLEPVKVEEKRPAYPSSSKKHVDWDKIDKEMESELKKEKPEGEAALNELFKQIYANADEDTRRAMIKSYQTSGGTVLSTNWGEVREKDYEGRDRPDAPKGQEWAKPS